MTRASLACLLLASLPACVSEDAGYQDVRKVVASRTGHEVRWQHLDGDSASHKAVREVLAKPLSAEGAVKVALLNSPDLQAAFEELGIARGELASALRLPNPVAAGSLRLRQERSTTIDLSVTEDLSELIFMPLRHAAARAELDAAKLEVAARAMDLILEVRAAFYGYLADRQVLELRKAVLVALEASGAISQSLHDAGNVTELELASEQILAEEARVSQAVAQASLLESKERLNSLLGLSGGATAWTSEARLVEPPADLALLDLEPKAIEHSLDLAIIRHRLTAAARRAKLRAVEGWLPELKGGVTAEREENAWSYGPLAEVELPLFYQGQGEVARAEAETRQQRQLLAARAAQIRAVSRVAASRLAAARARAVHVKNVLLPARERIFEQTQLQFNAMAVSVFQLLTAKRDQIETAHSYVEALRDYWTARAEVEQLRSGRLPLRLAPEVR